MEELTRAKNSEQLMANSNASSFITKGSNYTTICVIFHVFPELPNSKSLNYLFIFIVLASLCHGKQKALRKNITDKKELVRKNENLETGNRARIGRHHVAPEAPPQRRGHAHLAVGGHVGLSRGLRGKLGQDGDYEEDSAAEAGGLGVSPGCKCPGPPRGGPAGTMTVGVGALARGGSSLRGEAGQLLRPLSGGPWSLGSLSRPNPLRGTGKLRPRDGERLSWVVETWGAIPGVPIPSRALPGDPGTFSL